jgi:diacylglycerol kinase (ATP)
MKILVIYNPQAGGGRAAKLLPEVEKYLKAKDIEARILLTKHTGHAVELAKTADISSFDAIIASGGDGTLFEVLNGYFNNPASKGIAPTDKTPIGLIPNGTGNAFMKELKLHKSDWKEAIDIIHQAHRKQLDVGHFVTEGKSYYFLNIVGMGFVSQVAQAAIPLKWMGNAAYTVATLQKLLGLKTQKMKIEIDGECIERDGVFAEVANSTFTGTSFHIAPKAKLDDGLLDLVLLNKISRLKLLRLFNSIYDGSHINYPEVEYIQAEKIKISEQYPSKLIPDGEILGKTPVEFECLPAAIPFLWRVD